MSENSWRHTGGGNIVDDRGVSVGTFIGDFRNRDRLICAVNEVEALREQVEKLTKERDKYNQEFKDACGALSKQSHECAALAEQVEKLTKELFDYRREFKDDREELREAEQQLAALVAQNEKFRKVLYHCTVGASGYAVEQLFIECLSLPNLATPVLNRIRAEGVREAQDIAWQVHKTKRGAATAYEAHEAVRAKVDKLEKQS